MVNGYMATSLREALEIRVAHDVVPYGGGTDLMIAADTSLTYLYVNRIPEMKQIAVDDAYVRIGASCTFTEVLASPLVPPLMKAAVEQIGAPAIRNGGTMGGNIGNGSAKADSVLIEFVLGAKLRLASVRGERIVPIEAFYKGRKQLDLAKDELIVEILLPKDADYEWYYEKVGARRALAISRISFAGLLRCDGDVITDFATAFGAVAGTVLRFPDVEAMVIGKTKAEVKAMHDAIVAAYGDHIVPTAGRVSKEYRKDVCLNLVEDFLTSKGL